MNITQYLKISNKKCTLNNKDFYIFDNNNESSPIKQLYKFIKLKYPKFYKMDILSKYGFIASEILISASKTIKTYKDDEVALLFANSNSSTQTDIKYFKTINKQKPSPSPSAFVYTLPNILLGEISIRNKWHGENIFFILPEFDAKFLSLYSESLLSNKTTKACIIAWVDIEEDNKDIFFALIEKDTKGEKLNKKNLIEKYTKWTT